MRILSPEIVEESDFSGTAYNSAYVSDVHVESLMAKQYVETIFQLKFFDTR